MIQQRRALDDRRAPRRSLAAAGTPASCQPAIPEVPAAEGDPVAHLAAARSQLARLKKSLREERRRGKAGHWSYDLNRHIALAKSHRSTEQRIATLARSGAGGRLALPARATASPASASATHLSSG